MRSVFVFGDETNASLMYIGPWFTLNTKTYQSKRKKEKKGGLSNDDV